MAGSLSEGQDIARQTLIDRLLDAVKQCQIRFGGKTELATENDSRISCLCAQWEAALQFGLKSNKKINPLRHVTDQVLLRTEGQSSFWQFVKEHLSTTEIRRFNSLQNVNTDIGRAHAWLRSALNEQSLEKCLHSFLGHRELLSSYYGQDALVMDEERSSMLPMMAAGLSSILFAINIDNAEFNVSKLNTTGGSLNIPLVPAPVVQKSAWQAPSPMYSMSGAPVKEKKKKKRKKANIALIENVEFDDKQNEGELKRSIPGNGNSADFNYPSTSLTVTKQGREISERFREVDCGSKDNLSGEGSDSRETLPSTASAKRSSHSSNRNEINSKVDEAIDDEPLVDLNSGVTLTPVTCPDEEKVWALGESDDNESPGSEGGVGYLVASRLFVGSNRDSSASSICTDDDVNDDTSLAIGATEAAIAATQDGHKEMTDFTRSSLVRTMGDGRMSPPNEATNSKEMTSGELKQAIVSMMLRKDEVEECNRSLRQLLDKEMVESASLRVQVDDLRTDLLSSKEAHHTAVHTLTSENDLLKHQLKKYVAAVQSLKRNEGLDIAVPGPRVQDDLPALSDEPHQQASDEEKRDFERKLIQVADMHGELIELNDRLQKMLNIREHQLRQLREELVNLRGPLPDDKSHDDPSNLDDFGPRLVPVNTRPLINIWIPSAFAQGKSSNVHHTYQVYVRIKDDEWNVYRRYSDFYSLHKKICKQYPAVCQFKFPQKKVLGNREAKFVEIRRKQLQSFLRKLINYSLRVVPELSENPCKATLLTCFPFFGQTAKEKTVTTTSSSNFPVHYTGL